MSGTWADAGLRVVWADFPEVIPDTIGPALRADAKAYWTFNEASGVRLDATGRGNDLSVNSSGETASVAGRVGNAFSIPVFAGPVTGALYHARNDDLTYYQKSVYYWAGWVKMLQDSVCPAIVSVWDSTYGEEFSLDYNQGGTFDISAGSSGYAVSDSITYSDWNFVELYAKYPSEDYGIAVNGGAFVTATGIGPYEVLDAKFVVGYYTDLGAFINHHNFFSIDEFGVWHRMLTADERAYLYNSGNGRTLYP